MDTPDRYFWARPLQPFLPGKHADVLVCITKDRIPIPDYCCRCGSSRPRLFPIKVRPTSDSAVANKIAGLLVGHIGAGIEYLARKKVDVPCCSSCLLMRRVGYVVALFFFLLGVAPSVMLAASDQAAKLQTTLPTELITVLSLFLVPAAGIGIASWCSWRSLPVIVYGVGDQLYFEFWSTQYQQQLLDLVSKEKGIPFPGGPK